MALPSAIAFEDFHLDLLDRDGRPWLRGPQLVAPLGMADDRGIKELYRRHSDEFTDAMTAVVKLDTAGGKQDVRIFSARGCWLLGMFARTERAKAFRAWVLDVLEGLAPAPGVAEAPVAYPRRGEADAVVDANRTFQAYLRSAAGLKLPLQRVANAANERVRSRSGVDVLADLGVLADELVPPAVAGPAALKSSPHDPWGAMVAEWCLGRHEVNPRDCLAELKLGNPEDKSAQVRLGRILIHLGYIHRLYRNTPRGRQWVRSKSGIPSTEFAGACHG